MSWSWLGKDCHLTLHVIHVVDSRMYNVQCTSTIAHTWKGKKNRLNMNHQSWTECYVQKQIKWNGKLIFDTYVSPWIAVHSRNANQTQCCAELCCPKLSSADCLNVCPLSTYFCHATIIPGHNFSILINHLFRFDILKYSFWFFFISFMLRPCLLFLPHFALGPFLMQELPREMFAMCVGFHPCWYVCVRVPVTVSVWVCSNAVKRLNAARGFRSGTRIERRVIL